MTTPDYSYSVEIKRLDNGPNLEVIPLVYINVIGEAALGRLLHGYAESIEDELPARQYDTDPPIIVRPDWFEKAIGTAMRFQEIEERARDITRTHSSPNAKLAALYILNGDESTRQELYETEPRATTCNAAGEIREF